MGLTDKIDGSTAILWVNEGKQTYIIDFTTQSFIYKSKQDNIPVPSGTIFIGEMISYWKNDEKHNAFMIFDILFYGNNDVRGLNLKQRHDKIRLIQNIENFANPPKIGDMIIALKHFTYIEIEKGREGEIFSNRFKDFQREITDKMKNMSFTYNCDGMIFNAIHSGFDTCKIFKLKFKKFNTVDFLSKIIEDNKATKTLKVALFVGANNQSSNSVKYLTNKYERYFSYEVIFPYIQNHYEYIPIPFEAQKLLPDEKEMFITTITYKKSPTTKEPYYQIEADSLVPIFEKNCGITDVNNNIVSVDTVFERFNDETVGEYAFNETKNKWELYKVRYDKTADYSKTKKYNLCKSDCSFGNNVNVALNTLESVLFPVTVQDLLNKDLLEYGQTEYFVNKNSAKSSIQAMRNFHNIEIKGWMYSTYCRNAEWIIELGVGRGSDINRWHSNGVKTVVGIDLDTNALQELVLRNKEKGGVTNIETIKGNLQTGLARDGVIEKDMKYKLLPNKEHYDCIVAQFFIHYVLEKRSNIQQLMRFVSSYLKPEGHFMFTTFNGERLNQFFIDKGNVVELRKNGDLLFKIEKLYEGSQLENFGQKVNVFVESIGSFNIEYLVNIDYLIEVARKENLVCIVNKPFAEFYKPNGKYPMSTEEQTYSFLNQVVVFKKVI
jgi:SAM-dependent methyltransferase